jgi:hypothetical protein
LVSLDSHDSYDFFSTSLREAEQKPATAVVIAALRDSGG